MNSGFLNALLNATIVTVSRVFIGDEQEVDLAIHLSNTLLLTTSEGKVFEILLHIDNGVEMREIFSNEDLAAGFERETGDILWYQELQPVENDLVFTVPFSIYEITEVWRQVDTEYGPYLYLATIVLWDAHQHAVLCILIAPDEIMLESLESAQKDLGRIALSPSIIETRRYQAT